MEKSHKISFIFILLVLFVWASLTWGKSKPIYITKESLTPSSNDNIYHGSSANDKISTSDKFRSPLDRPKDRTTKKLFGTFVTPENSPVKPERFYGYHTGTDFEIFPEELNKDVLIKAICDGKILSKGWAGGYGGVLVQSCTLNNQSVTVIYGHLKLDSIPKKIGDQLIDNEQFALLGQDKSRETNGERKHLHLGIHKGTSINIRGYVNNKSQLGDWVDPLSVL